VKEGVNFGRGKPGFHDYVRVKGKEYEQTVDKIPEKFLHTQYENTKHSRPTSRLAARRSAT
jgi:hypothetical protein